MNNVTINAIERPKARVIAELYPELWKKFVDACEREARGKTK